uniref:Mitochondrial transcription rescue factor 1 C-terminal domain-containing protein n=1 Tax=Rhipicephalus zambeziensis TaxID=60191 RepID=A0A224YHG8_9ACAR
MAARVTTDQQNTLRPLSVDHLCGVDGPADLSLLKRACSPSLQLKACDKLLLVQLQSGQGRYCLGALTMLRVVARWSVLRRSVVTAARRSMARCLATDRSPGMLLRVPPLLAFRTFPYLQPVRSKSKKAKSKATQDEEDEEEEDRDEEGESQEPGDNEKTAYVSSLRIDSIMKAGVNLSKTKVVESFYSGSIRLNGRKVTKKSTQGRPRNSRWRSGDHGSRPAATGQRGWQPPSFSAVKSPLPRGSAQAAAFEERRWATRTATAQHVALSLDSRCAWFPQTKIYKFSITFRI